MRPRGGRAPAGDAAGSFDARVGPARRELAVGLRDGRRGMGRGGKRGEGPAAALAEAQSLMLHSRLDEAVATALTALGAPPPSAAPAWEDVIDELPPAAKPTASVVQLSCIAVQGAYGLGKAESAVAIAGRLFARQGADAGAAKAAAAAPVEVALSLAHGLASAGQRDEAEKILRARLAADSGAKAGSGGSDTPPASPGKSARSDGALLTEYLLFHLLCPPTIPGTALTDPAKRIKAVEGARKFLKGNGSPRLPKPVKDAFVGRLDAFEEEAVAALKLAKDEEKRRKRAAAAVVAEPAAAPAAAAAPGTPAAPSASGGELRSARKQERSIGREVQPAYVPPPPSFAVRLLRAILTVKGIGTVGILAVLSYLLSKSALGRWLYEQLDGMWQLATSVRM